MEDKYFYSTEVEWTGARNGDLTAGSLPKLHVDAPPEFKGHEGAWTPEHLFVGAVNSCLVGECLLGKPHLLSPPSHSNTEYLLYFLHAGLA